MDAVETARRVHADPLDDEVRTIDNLREDKADLQTIARASLDLESRLKAARSQSWSIPIFRMSSGSSTAGSCRAKSRCLLATADSERVDSPVYCVFAIWEDDLDEFDRRLTPLGRPDATQGKIEFADLAEHRRHEVEGLR